VGTNSIYEFNLTTPWPKAKKKNEFPSEINFFIGLRPRGGQIIGKVPTLPGRYSRLVGLGVKERKEMV
jgi:hypothetical protein